MKFDEKIKDIIIEEKNSLLPEDIKKAGENLLKQLDAPSMINNVLTKYGSPLAKKMHKKIQKDIDSFIDELTINLKENKK